MVYRFRLCLLAALFATTTLCSAQTQKLTLAEATNGLATTLALKSIRQPSWQPGTHHFFQVVKGANTEYLVRTRVPEMAADTLCSVADFKNLFKEEQAPTSFGSLQWTDESTLMMTRGQQVYRAVVRGDRCIWRAYATLPTDAENMTIDKQGQIGYTINNNLWMIDGDGQTLAVTDEADKNVVSGQSVHRNEFGINGGIFFSPGGRFLAYYHMDQRAVADYPITKWASVPAVVDAIKYPMAGGASHAVTVRVFNPRTRKTTILETGKPDDHYLTSVTWSPDEKYIYIGILNREQNHLWLNQYDVSTGKKLRTLFEEKSRKYVEPQHPLTFLPKRSDRFVWWSQRDGYTHLYLYRTDGRLVRQLTRGPYDVNELLGFDEARGTVLVSSAQASPLEKHLYAVSLDGSYHTRLDREPGVHNAIASADGAYLFDTYSSATRPRVCAFLRADGEQRRVVLDAPNTIAAYQLAAVKSVRLKAADGTPLYGKLMLPADFDPGKKYPVIVYLYNGPHVQLVRNTFPESGNLWYDYLTQRGYLVFTMDGRGSANRGRQFEQATFRQLGTVEMEDQLRGVAYLKSLPYVDAGRLGVHGWSFGGFMTTSLMLRHPDVFKVGVAGGPVMDWSLYEVMYTERYMDTPSENPDGYAAANLLTKTKQLKGKLLLIHGTDDDVVVWQHSINFLKRSVDEGVQVDYFVYPGHEHNVRGKDRVHLMQKVTDYFDTYLK